jgi:hypothetical protein
MLSFTVDTMRRFALILVDLINLRKKRVRLIRSWPVYTAGIKTLGKNISPVEQKSHSVPGFIDVNA